jgi:Flp pilus assembly protein TadG
VTGKPTHRNSKSRRQGGLAMIELALTLPLLLTVLSGIVQFGGMFFIHNRMINVARDVTRRLAVGEITSSQAQSMVASNLSSWPATFQTFVYMPTSTSNDVTVEIRVPKAQVSLMDIFGMFQSGNLVAKVTMRQEEDLS